MSQANKSALLHDVDALTELYELPNAADLAKITGKSPTIVETLLEAREKIDQFFGKRARPRLSYEPDPDIRGLEVILVGIAGSSDIDDDMRRLERFDKEWWLEASLHEAAEVCIVFRT